MDHQSEYPHSLVTGHVNIRSKRLAKCTRTPTTTDKWEQTLVNFTPDVLVNCIEKGDAAPSVRLSRQTTSHGLVASIADSSCSEATVFVSTHSGYEPQDDIPTVRDP